MPTYIVTRKADGAEVLRYQSGAPIEWDGVPFATHDHTEHADPGVLPAPYTGSWRITRLAFRNRFTTTEKATMEIAGIDNPAAPMLQRQQAAVLRAYMADVAASTYVADVAASTYVDLQRPDTRAGVQQLEALGLIAPGRAAKVLDTPPADVEVFNG